MGTSAIIGVGSVATGWSGTYVGYDGDPETLGPRLLGVVLDHEGDLPAAWAYVRIPAAGWRFAFSEPYDDERRDRFETGRQDGPLLRHSDAFVTGDYGDGAVHLDGPAYWYLFDLEARTLHVWETPSRLEPQDPALLHVAHFDARGNARFERSPGPLDWTNRRTSYGDDDPAATAASVLATIERALPIVGGLFSLARITEQPGRLEDRGLVVPLAACSSSEAPVSENVEDIAEHDRFLMLPRRALRDRARCERAVGIALGAIAEHAAAGRTADLSYCEGLFADLFPMDLLDLELAPDVLSAAIAARIAATFGGAH